MKHKKVEKLLFRYAFGTLPDAQREKVETHLRECESCREEAALIKKAIPGMQSRPLFNVSEQTFAETKELVRRASAAGEPPRPELSAGGFIERVKSFFPVSWPKIRLVLKPAFAVLMLLLLSLFIYLNSFVRPGQVFTFNLPFSLFQQADIT